MHHVSCIMYASMWQAFLVDSTSRAPEHLPLACHHRHQCQLIAHQGQSRLEMSSAALCATKYYMHRLRLSAPSFLLPPHCAVRGSCLVRDRIPCTCCSDSPKWTEYLPTPHTPRGLQFYRVTRGQCNQLTLSQKCIIWNLSVKKFLRAPGLSFISGCCVGNSGTQNPAECLPRNPVDPIELHCRTCYRMGFENHAVVVLMRNSRGA